MSTLVNGNKVNSGGKVFSIIIPFKMFKKYKVISETAICRDIRQSLLNQAQNQGLSLLKIKSQMIMEYSYAK